MTAKYHNGWVGVDLDGTLAVYEGYKGEDHIGAPIRPMVERVLGWLGDGYEVRIFTARKPSLAIRKWVKEHIGHDLKITNEKDPHMLALYDDRAVGVRRNEGQPFDPANEKQVWRKG